MKIEKAIEILDYKLQFLYDPNLTDSKDAIKLGIEALKRVVDFRRLPRVRNWKPLPGETADD